jgi:hypothetical protein
MRPATRSRSLSDRPFSRGTCRTPAGSRYRHAWLLQTGYQ